MTAKAISLREWLVVMRLAEVGVVRVVTINAQRRRVLREMELEFPTGTLTRFVRHVTGGAAHIQGGVTTALLGRIYSGVMAGETEILGLAGTGHIFKQLVFVIGAVRIVALKAISRGRGVDLPLDLTGILVGVTLQTEAEWRGGRQLNAGDFFVATHFVATEAPGRHRRMHRLTLGFVLVTLGALGRVSILVQWHRVLLGQREHAGKHHHS